MAQLVGVLSAATLLDFVCELGERRSMVKDPHEADDLPQSNVTEMTDVVQADERSLPKSPQRANVMQVDDGAAQRKRESRTPVHIERLQVRLRSQVVVKSAWIESKVRDLVSNLALIRAEQLDTAANEELHQSVQTIRVSFGVNGLGEKEELMFWQILPIIHIYRTYEDEPCDHAEEHLGNDEQGDATTASHIWSLPSSQFEGLMENLVFDSDIKEDLLQYVSSAMMFSERNVDPNVITWNRVVLLHGPPGTGKTTLCKALAQKLSIRLSKVYTEAQLVEVNAHSLFSKWFSESGKLVGKLFARIHEICDNPEVLTCVLIDEVESLTAARQTVMSGLEPSDALRVVNAVLTELDSLKRRRNVLIMTTSNVTEAVDTAFLDRVDIKQYIGPPGAPARRAIVQSCMEELSRCGVVSVDPDELSSDSQRSELSALIDCTAGFSGRQLRRLPFIAHARHLRRGASTGVPCKEFIEALNAAAQREAEAKALLTTKN